MEDNRDKLIPAQLAGWTWDLTAYAAKVPFYNADDLTMREVQIVFQGPVKDWTVSVKPTRA